MTNYLRLRFAAYDPEGTGHVAVSSVPQLLRSVGFFTLSELELDVLTKAVDVDGTGRVLFEDFEKLCTRKRVDKATPEEVWQAFHLWDPSHVQCKSRHMIGLMQSSQCAETVEALQGAFSSVSTGASGGTASGATSPRSSSNPSVHAEDATITFDQFRFAMNSIHAATRKSTKM